MGKNELFTRDECQGKLIPCAACDPPLEMHYILTFGELIFHRTLTFPMGLIVSIKVVTGAKLDCKFIHVREFFFMQNTMSYRKNNIRLILPTGTYSSL